MKAFGKVTIDRALKDKDILRRYLDLPRFVAFLKTASLYLCRSDLFPDKFEGSFTPTIREAIRESYLANSIGYTYEQFKRDLRQGVYLSCWAHGVDDNMALWRLYGKMNDCVAITTSVAKFKDALRRYHGRGSLFLMKVNYVKHWNDPEIEYKPYSSVFRYKAVGYAFENEVRLILDRVPTTPAPVPADEGVDLLVNMNAFLRSIVVSPESSPWFKSVIEDIAGKYGVTCPVRNSSMAKEPI